MRDAERDRARDRAQTANKQDRMGNKKDKEPFSVRMERIRREIKRANTSRQRSSGAKPKTHKDDDSDEEDVKTVHASSMLSSSDDKDDFAVTRTNTWEPVTDRSKWPDTRTGYVDSPYMQHMCESVHLLYAHVCIASRKTLTLAEFYALVDENNTHANCVAKRATCMHTQTLRLRRCEPIRCLFLVDSAGGFVTARASGCVRLCTECMQITTDMATLQEFCTPSAQTLKHWNEKVDHAVQALQTQPSAFCMHALDTEYPNPLLHEFFNELFALCLRLVHTQFAIFGDRTYNTVPALRERLGVAPDVLITSRHVVDNWLNLFSNAQKNMCTRNCSFTSFSYGELCDSPLHFTIMGEREKFCASGNVMLCTQHGTLHHRLHHPLMSNSNVCEDDASMFCMLCGQRVANVEMVSTDATAGAEDESDTEDVAADAYQSDPEAENDANDDNDVPVDGRKRASAETPEAPRDAAGTSVDASLARGSGKTMSAKQLAQVANAHVRGNIDVMNALMPTVKETIRQSVETKQTGQALTNSAASNAKRISHQIHIAVSQFLQQTNNEPTANAMERACRDLHNTVVAYVSGAHMLNVPVSLCTLHQLRSRVSSTVNVNSNGVAPRLDANSVYRRIELYTLTVGAVLCVVRDNNYASRAHNYRELTYAVLKFMRTSGLTVMGHMILPQDSFLVANLADCVSFNIKHADIIFTQNMIVTAYELMVHKLTRGGGLDKFEFNAFKTAQKMYAQKTK